MLNIVIVAGILYIFKLYKMGKIIQPPYCKNLVKKKWLCIQAFERKRNAYTVLIFRQDDEDIKAEILNEINKPLLFLKKT